MAADSNKFPALFIVCVVLFLHVSLDYASAHWSKGLFRNRRQVCADGFYQHEGRNCCLCAAGERLVEHCSANPADRKCEHCEGGTYNSHPNSQDTCVPCTSCSQPNANLEVVELCTRARDTKCRCKKDHYCEGLCKLCHPCEECGFAGVKEACTANSNTVCNDNSKRNAVIIVLVFVVVGVILLIACFVVRKWKQRGRKTDEEQMKRPSEELKLLNGADLQPLLSDIADELGWRIMKDVADRTCTKESIIESCEREHPGSSQEQTRALLKQWVEIQGRDAPKKLIDTLEKAGKNVKAENMKKMLSRSDSA